MQTLGLTGPTYYMGRRSLVALSWVSCYLKILYEDRLAFAGSPNDPDTSWLTVDEGDYISFLVSQPVGEDFDGIDVQLTSRQLNAINGMVAFQAITCAYQCSILVYSTNIRGPL